MYFSTTSALEPQIPDPAFGRSSSGTAPQFPFPRQLFLRRNNRSLLPNQLANTSINPQLTVSPAQVRIDEVPNARAISFTRQGNRLFRHSPAKVADALRRRRSNFGRMMTDRILASPFPCAFLVLPDSSNVLRRNSRPIRAASIGDDESPVLENCSLDEDDLLR